MSETHSSDGRVPNTLEFDGLYELEQVAEQVPDVTRRKTKSENPETGEMEIVSWRDTIWTDEDSPRMCGNVSANRRWYKVIQYGDILSSVVAGINTRPEDIQPTGTVNLSKSAHRMTARVDLNRTIEPSPGDKIDLDLRISAGHSGSHAVTYEVGAVRQVCANGMTAFVADASFRQTHQNHLRHDRVHDSISLIMDGDVFETRLAEAKELSLRNTDEALLVILDVLDADYMFRNPIDAIRTGLNEEVSNPDAPSLFETYQAATYALSHLTNKPDHILADAHVDAAKILERSHTDPEQSPGLPDPSALGSRAVESRSDELIDGGADAEERFDGEREVVRGLMTL